MIKDKKDVQSFVSQYIKDDKNNPPSKYLIEKGKVSTLGFISYHTFDKEQLKKDSEKIIAFFTENFAIGHRIITYWSLLKTPEEKIWLNIESISDIELLDQLIALGIAAKVLEENFEFRYDNLLFNAELLSLINENPKDLQCYSEENYLRLMTKSISSCKLQVSQNIVDHYDVEHKNFSISRIKELLIAWWDQGMKDSNDESTRDMFLDILKSQDLYALCCLVYSLYSRNESSRSLAESIQSGIATQQIIMAKNAYYNSTLEEQKEIDAELDEMFGKINEMDQNEKRLG